MVPWKETLKPTDIQKVASYVLSLQGTNPPGAKPAEGDVWKDDAANATAVKDSLVKETTTVVIDTTKTK